MRLATRSGLKRLAILLLVVGALVLGGWCSMMRMPLKSDHTGQDTPDKLDYERFARVVAGVDRVLEDLATR